VQYRNYIKKITTRTNIGMMEKLMNMNKNGKIAMNGR
jgi:hypothetical protein